MRGTLRAATLVELRAGRTRPDPSPPTVEAPSAGPAAERADREGFRHQQRGDGARAARTFREAVGVREAYPEAWNGLGIALRQQGQSPEALRASGRALQLRPDYPQAPEYLGEAPVRLGRLEEAPGVLAHLERLDPVEAGRLRAVIEQAPGGGR